MCKPTDRANVENKCVEAADVANPCNAAAAAEPADKKKFWGKKLCATNESEIILA